MAIEKVRVDAQGRLVLPQQIRRRLRIDGRAAELCLTPAEMGVLLSPPDRRVCLETAEDGMPAVTIDWGDKPVTAEEVASSIDEERSER